ncbi:MAG: hypothetical protein J6O73_03845 [Lachnospiraceae bacterium]|nr:hypothetical protein [Lachnospiraceae bacterium]
MNSGKKTGISTVLLVALSVLFAFACLHILSFLYDWRFRDHPKKPDDELSSLLSDQHGDKFYYNGSYTSPDGGKVYSFIEHGFFSTEELYAFIGSINDFISGSKEKVCIRLCYSNPGRYVLPEVSLSNYSDEALPEADYQGLYSVTVYSEAVDSIWYSPETYMGMKGIRRLVINERNLRDNAIFKGINWRSVWPEIEYVSVCRDGRYDTGSAIIVPGSKDMVYKLGGDPDAKCHIKLAEESDRAVFLVYLDDDSNCLLKKDIEYSEGDVFEIFLFETHRDVHKYKLFIYNTTEKDGIINYEYKLIRFDEDGKEVVEDQTSVCGDRNDPGVKKDMEDFIISAYFYKDNGMFFAKVEGDQCIFSINDNESIR